MISKLHQVPAGVELPPRYARTFNSRRHYVIGFYDGVEGLSMPDAEDYRRHQGTTAWRACQDGYKAGKEWKDNRPG